MLSKSAAATLCLIAPDHLWTAASPLTCDPMPRLPAEFEPHERTLMGWPCRRELWGETLDAARADYAAVARAVARFEPVTMIANPGRDAVDAGRLCGPEVEVVELPLDDSWLRDCGPVYVVDDRGRRVALHFRFNAWGGRFPPWERDAAVGGLVASRLGDEVVEVPMVLEGGSILCDGEGTLLTTEQCLLSPNRNPEMSFAEIDAELVRRFGLDRVVWLGQGLAEDRDTDGHVDLVASVCGPRRVLLQAVGDRSNPNFERCRENRARLDAAGIEVVEMPLLPYAEVAGRRVAVSYLNLYLCNGAAIVGVCGSPSDDAALAIVGDAFPGREVVPVPGAVLAYGGGGPHCITQQVPLAIESHA
jgi:agmatine deiminase